MIAYKTPFEIYFARKCNALRECRLQDEILPCAGGVRPIKKDRNQGSRQALKLRKQAKKATSRCDKRMQQTQLRSHSPSVYSIGESVFRLRGKPSNKRHLTEGRINKRKIKLHVYNVSFISPLSGNEEWKWISVDDITGLTLEQEKQKQKCPKLSKTKKIDHHKKY